VASASVRNVVIERASLAGLYIAGSTVDVREIVVRETRSSTEGRYGRGVSIEGDPPWDNRANVILRSILVERNVDAGIVVQGSDAHIEGCVVQDIEPQPIDGQFGRAVDIQSSTAVVRSCVLRRAIEHGLNVSFRAEVVAEHLTVQDIRSIPATGIRGVALSAHESSLTVRGCLLENCRSFGVGVVSATAELERTLIRGTRAGENGLLGDGLVAASTSDPGEVAVSNSRIEDSERAGVANFAGIVHMGESQFECNTIHLDGEQSYGKSFSFTDQGGNACGCGSHSEQCQVLSANLQPPDFGN
jgi:hypothetical protein